MEAGQKDEAYRADDEPGEFNFVVVGDAAGKVVCDLFVESDNQYTCDHDDKSGQ
ncbi:hypothetical protein IJ102_00025 [Candidatus Saccharibacteria bacterium]|nr:hypothetical protein [Candidatus Saccharibacteria bacterium]